MRNIRRPGLTLIEMLVVLTILAVLTTLAVTLTESTVDQARFNATQQQLQAIKDAMLGPAGQVDAPSFVGDVGRLPAAYVYPTDPAGELQLAELWANPNGLPAFGAYCALNPTSPTPAYVDPSVTVMGGWRGPYVTLPPGQASLRDGWGNPFAFLQPDGLTAVTAAGQMIGQVHSAGGPNAPYAQLLALPTSIITTATTPPTSYWSPVSWTAQSLTTAPAVTGSINSSNPLTSPLPTDLTVLLFVPDMTKTTTGFVRVMTYHANAANGYTFRFPVLSTDPNYSTYVNTPSQPLLTDSLSDATHTYVLPIGPKAIRVYPYLATGLYWQGATTSGSGVVNLKVPAGGVTRTLYYP
jgi:prepilin-type N-terminal cleavage/methylation domain-containing protein